MRRRSGHRVIVLDARKLPERAQDCNSLDELARWMQANNVTEYMPSESLAFRLKIEARPTFREYGPAC